MRGSIYKDIPIAAPAKPDPDAAPKAAKFGDLCRGDIHRALTATYAHRTPDEQAAYLQQDLNAAVGLARVAGHHGRRAIDQRRLDEALSLLRAVRRQETDRRRLEVGR
jgi:hypothetical protein